MTYSDLFHAVESRLQSNITFTVDVKTWRYGHGRVETTWDIYVCWNKDDAAFYSGSTPEVALATLDAGVAEKQTLDQTSDAVGTAEV